MPYYAFWEFEMNYYYPQQGQATKDTKDAIELPTELYDEYVDVLERFEELVGKITEYKDRA